MKAKRYKTKYKKGSILESLTWVGYDRESLLGYMKAVTDKGKEDPKNTEQTPNREEEPKQQHRTSI